MSEEGFPPDPKGNIDLKELLDVVLKESVEEKRKEAALKIRFVIGGLAEAKIRIKKANEAIAKDEERIKKGLEKIERIKSGDWNILNSINVNEREDQNKENKQ